MERMITAQDPLGLIRQMYPRLWGPGKVQEVRKKDRLSQIMEIQEHWKKEDRMKELTMHDIRAAVEKVFEGREIGVEEVGVNMYKIGTGREVFYTDRAGVEKFALALREREKGV